jgi:hypothetical protein
MSQNLSNIITTLIPGVTMKSLIRWGAALGIIGVTLLGPSFTGGMQALALPQDQVLQKLQVVPVFTIRNEKGESPIVEVPNGQSNSKSKVAGVFMSQKDAQGFLDGLKTKNPDLAKNMQVVPISLGDIYKLAQENQNKPDRLMFDFIPTQEEVDLAGALKQPSGDPVDKEKIGVPLFVARAGVDKGYLTFQRGNDPVVPFFFAKEDLQNLINVLKQQQPNMTTSIDIQVVPLEVMLQRLQSGNDPQLSKIELAPSCDALTSVGVTQKPIYCVAPSSPTNTPPK